MAAVMVHVVVAAQKIDGQWRGFFDNKGDIVLSGENNTEFVLEIEVDGKDISGFSYTYFDNRKYYVICALSGTYFKSTNSLRVTETSKVKSSTPPGWQDCLQTHILTYDKLNGVEELKGSWKTAPGQNTECGSGLTTVNRRTLQKDLSSFNKEKNSAPTDTEGKKIPALADKNKKSTAPPVVKSKPVERANKPAASLRQKEVAKKMAPVDKASSEMMAQDAKQPSIGFPDLSGLNFEKRNSELLKTIEISSDQFSVELYDNGTVDGDSISVFYNGKLLLSHQRLSEKPISLGLDATTDKTVNELTMYAENLGTYPPNTALMVVKDGDKRYEVRISSDLKKSGTIRFIHVKK